MKPITDHWERKKMYAQLDPCEAGADDDGVSCLWCRDTGIDGVTDKACPECELGIWNNVTELWDEARQGR